MFLKYSGLGTSYAIRPVECTFHKIGAKSQFSGDHPGTKHGLSPKSCCYNFGFLLPKNTQTAQKKDFNLPNFQIRKLFPGNPKLNLPAEFWFLWDLISPYK
jgi:hypothetical protein